MVKPLAKLTISLPTNKSIDAKVLSKEDKISRLISDKNTLAIHAIVFLPVSGYPDTYLIKEISKKD